MADVSGCVEEYRLCCQPSVSLMKIGMQVSCHSFSVSVHESRAAALQRPFPPSPPHYKRQDIIHAGRQTPSQAGEGGREETERQRRGGEGRGRGEAEEEEEMQFAGTVEEERPFLSAPVWDAGSAGCCVVVVVVV